MGWVGRDLPDGRLNAIKAMHSVKDEVQYGVRTSAQDGAERALKQLERFSALALSWLETKSVSWPVKAVASSAACLGQHVVDFGEADGGTQEPGAS